MSTHSQGAKPMKKDGGKRLVRKNEQPSPSATVNVRMPTMLKGWLEERARSRGRSLNQEIVASLELRFEAGALMREVLDDTYGLDARELLAAVQLIKTTRDLERDGRMTHAQAEAVVASCREKIERLGAAL
jgi:hypothetical protein